MDQCRTYLNHIELCKGRTAVVITAIADQITRSVDEVAGTLAAPFSEPVIRLGVTGLIVLVETTLLAPLDAAAQREVEVAARQVATVTAIVPLALADVFAALTSNLRMIRRIAEVYGGRSGLFGSWHLTRTVLMHLVATGVVALGDDLIGSIAGGRRAFQGVAPLWRRGHQRRTNSPRRRCRNRSLPPAPICDGQTPVGNRLGQAIPDGLVRRGLAQARGLPDGDGPQHHLLIGKAKRDINGL